MALARTGLLALIPIDPIQSAISCKPCALFTKVGISSDPGRLPGIHTYGVIGGDRSTTPAPGFTYSGQDYSTNPR